MRYTHGPIRRARRRAAAFIALALLLIPMRSARAGGEQEMPFTAQEATAEPQAPGAIEPQAENTVMPAQMPYETTPPHTQLDFPMDAVAAPQSIDGTVPMFRRADEGSEVLMEYYSGARLTALHPAGGGFWKVQAGVKGAGIMGYMRAEDLLFGTSAQREVTVCYMELRFNRDAPVYAFRDTGSKVIGTCDTEHTYYAMSRTDDKWVQLFLPPLPHAAEQKERQTEGFVYMETGLGHGYFHQLINEYGSDEAAWTVTPLQGELTEAGAIAWAVDYLVSLPDEDTYTFINLIDNGATEPFFDREQLGGMHARAELEHFKGAYRSGLTQYAWDGNERQRWYVFFWEDIDEGVMYVYLNGFDENGQIIAYAGFVEAGDYSNYTIPLIL